MTRRFSAALLAAAALQLCGLAYAQQDITLREAAYRAGKARIAALYKLKVAACDGIVVGSKDDCLADARARRIAARSELQRELAFTPSIAKLALASSHAPAQPARALPHSVVFAAASTGTRTAMAQGGCDAGTGVVRVACVLPLKAKFGDN